MQNIAPLQAVKSILVCKSEICPLIMLWIESDLKGKYCEEDDEAEGDACRDHDGVNCVDQTHLGNQIVFIDNSEFGSKYLTRNI